MQMYEYGVCLNIHIKKISFCLYFHLITFSPSHGQVKLKLKAEKQASHVQSYSHLLEEQCEGIFTFE